MFWNLLAVWYVHPICYIIIKSISTRFIRCYTFSLPTVSYRRSVLIRCLPPQSAAPVWCPSLTCQCGRLEAPSSRRGFTDSLRAAHCGFIHPTDMELPTFIPTFPPHALFCFVLDIGRGVMIWVGNSLIYHRYGIYSAYLRDAWGVLLSTLPLPV